MKNVEVFTGTDLVSFINSKWQTDEFRQACKIPNHPIQQIVKQVSYKPMWFYDMSDPIERTQFSSWWRHIQNRQYDNPSVNDLYLIHELHHISNMKFYSDNVWMKWVDDVFENELEASMFSEVLIYFMFPTLRDKTFNHEIWADRFLKINFTSIETKARWAREERLRIFKEPNFDDPIEMSIHKYYTQNLIWCKYWETAYKAVNSNMKEFHGMTANGEAINWMENFIKQNTTDDVVFRKETRLFNEYVKNSIITIFKT
jgi:hypothetical protein